MNKKLDNIYLAVEVGYSIEGVAKAYIEAFNKSGAYMITNFMCRQPTEQEILQLQKRIHPREIKKVNGICQSILKLPKGKVEKKNIFVLVPTDHKKISDSLVKLRPTEKDFTVEVMKDEQCKPSS